MVVAGAFAVAVEDMAGVLQEGDGVSAAAAAVQGGLRESEALRAAAEGVAGVTRGIATAIPRGHTEVARWARSFELAETAIGALATAVLKRSWQAGVVCLGSREGHSVAVRRCSSD